MKSSDVNLGSSLRGIVDSGAVAIQTKSNLAKSFLDTSMVGKVLKFGIILTDPELEILNFFKIVLEFPIIKSEYFRLFF
jgi:hypothetical protein